MVSDCEELVGDTHRRWWGWIKGGYSEEKSHLNVYINVTEY